MSSQFHPHYSYYEGCQLHPCDPFSCKIVKGFKVMPYMCIITSCTIRIQFEFLKFYYYSLFDFCVQCIDIFVKASNVSQRHYTCPRLLFFLYLCSNGIARWFIDIGKEVLLKPTQKRNKNFLDNC
jgi:hypothetical protein